MAKCPECNSVNARFPYNYKEKGYQCPICEYIVKVLPIRRRCRCGHEYDEYTWFDPSGCPSCKRSFVE